MPLIRGIWLLYRVAVVTYRPNNSSDLCHMLL